MPVVDRRVYIDSASLHRQLKGRPDEDTKEAVGGAEEDARRYTKHVGGRGVPIGLSWKHLRAVLGYTTRYFAVGIGFWVHGKCVLG